MAFFLTSLWPSGEGMTQPWQQTADAFSDLWVSLSETDAFRLLPINEQAILTLDRSDSAAI